MDALLKHSNVVIVVCMKYEGYHAAFYEFVETPKNIGLGVSGADRTLWIQPRMVSGKENVRWPGA